MKELKGELNGQGFRFGIVISRFNESIVSNLLGGAVEALKRNGVPEDFITTVWVPGAFEIPLTAQKMAASGCYDAIITLGCVIRGDTTHYDYVAGESAAGISKASLKTGIPILLGILTTENREQAKDRSGGKHGNKGTDVAEAAIEMATLLQKLSSVSISSC